MSIKIRCTQCRARLHVPSHAAGTSVPCPRCRTRVMVPTTTPEGLSAFESPEVERSLSLLERARRQADGASDEPPPTAAVAAGVTLPRWAVYAGAVAVVAVAGAAFAAGFWWARATGG